MSRRERHRRRRRHRGSPIKRILIMGFLLSICGLTLGALALVGWVVSVADSAPNLNELKPQVQGQLSQVFASNGQSLGYIQSDNLRSPVPSWRIPTILRHATIAIEDRRFYQHGALDYTGIIRAAFKDLFNGGNALQGASTLTMQLVRNLYLPKASRNLHYKIVQAKLAEQLFKLRGRAWILNNYLNDVPYGTVGGQTAYGVGAASRMFFDKPVWKIDLAQAALLAGMPQAPGGDYNPFTNPGAARQRRHEVLTAMAQSHYISQAQADAADASPLQAYENGSYSVRQQPYVFDYVQQELLQKFCPKNPGNCPQVTQGGLKIYTTIDPARQQEATAAILHHEGGPGQPAAALASINPLNGEIEALATSSSYTQTSFDYASSAHRSSGSSFKVFALMTLMNDYDGDPDQTFYNSHFLQAGWLPQDPTWSVHTAEETYQGHISISKATTVSDNTVFAQLAADLGWSKIDVTAHAMGVTSPLDGNPAEVIGGLRIGVTPLEMADAYGTLASGGIHHAPTAISKVVFRDGSVVNFADATGNRVFPYNMVYAADQVLKTVVTGGTGTAADYGCPAAGKTGTSENLANAWFVGYTPQLSTAVWVGYPQGNIPMSNGFGGTLAAPIWHDYMLQASDGFCDDFTAPPVPWHGTAFFGHFATTGAANNNNNNGTTTSTTATTPTTPTNTTPTPPPPTTGNGNGNGQGNGNGNGNASGGGGVNPPPGFGNGHLPGGNGKGKGH